MLYFQSFLIPVTIFAGFGIYCKLIRYSGTYLICYIACSSSAANRLCFPARLQSSVTEPATNWQLFSCISILACTLVLHTAPTACILACPSLSLSLATAAASSLCRLLLLLSALLLFVLDDPVEVVEHIWIGCLQPYVLLNFHLNFKQKAQSDTISLIFLLLTSSGSSPRPEQSGGSSSRLMARNLDTYTTASLIWCSLNSKYCCKNGSKTFSLK